MSIILVEGPDGSGKSTLLKNLRAESSRYFWILSSSRRPYTLEELNDAVGYIGQAAYLRLPVVCDRFPLISEAIYGPLIRGTSILTQLNARDSNYYNEILEEEIDRVIYCRPPLQNIIENVNNNPQMEGVRNRIKELVLRYDSFMDHLREGVKVFNFDYTSPKYTLDQLFFGRLRD